jgi:hypothetical protein
LSSMKYECRVNEKSVMRKVPITLTFHLLSAEEMAQQQKKLEEAKAALQKANEPKDFEPGERAKLLRELRSSDNHRIGQAADRLAHVPADENSADISKALALLLRHSDRWVQKSAAEALAVWATPDAENALIKTSQSDDVFLRGPAIKALGKLKSAKAAEAVAAQMYQQASRRDVSDALKAMGPVAEPATIALLNDRDMWVRSEACSVLKEIGGKKSLDALNKFVAKAAVHEDGEAKNAISAIELRLESKGESDVQPEESTTKSTDAERSSLLDGSTGLRTWRDASGTFSVEAVMLSVDGDKVVLQKKDGKISRVPIAKLSPADKKYIAEHAGDAPSKAENPFE